MRRFLLEVSSKPSVGSENRLFSGVDFAHNRVLKWLLAGTTILCLMILPAASFAGTPSEESTPEVAATTSETWGHIVIKGSYPESPQLPGLFSQIVEGLADGVARFDKAAADEDLTGVILEIKSPGISWGKLNEFRRAIERLRASGKKVYATLEQGSTADYLLAAGCDEIVMPEPGVLMLLGLRAEVSFYKNLFDKLDVKADMLKVGEYKSAAEPYTRTEMSSAFREEMEAILDSYMQQIVDAISKGRGLDHDQVKEAIDTGPHTPQAAKELGLIDHVAYADEIEGIVAGGRSDVEVKLVKRYGKKKADTDFSGFAGMMKLMNLMMGIEPSKRRSLYPKIAVIHADGMILTGRSSSGLFGGNTLGSETFIKAVKTANEDSTVKAIVVRVNSPGGSALASDLMWRSLERVDKPVVVSMGDVAASGGYYISMGADRIYAEPGTLTGSIGVVGGKFALNGLFNKVGITTSVISRGKNSGLMSTLDGFTESERATMQKMLDAVYDQFTRKAAEGRKMEQSELEKLARGRVYTGQMALEVGLVDELGTLDDAVAHARKLADLTEDDKVERLILPRPPSPLEQLFGPLDADAQSESSAALKNAVETLSPELASQFKAVELISILAREPRLTLMPFRLSVR